MNVNFDVFTYITGIAGLLGLVLQVSDSFPEHRETRKAVVLLVIGIFVGSTISSLKGIRIDFGSSISPFEALVGVFVGVVAIIAIAGAFTRDAARRSELFVFSGGGIFALFFLLMFGGMSTAADSQAERERKQVNIEELLELSTMSANKGNYERALLFLSDAKLRLPDDDARQAVLDNRIKDMKNRQVGLSRQFQSPIQSQPY